MKKTIAIILTLIMALVLVACGGSNDNAASTTTNNAPTAAEPAATEEVNAETFRHYSDEQWLNESFDNKAIAYQFVSPETNMDSIDYGYAFAACVNLYTDGSARVDLRNVVADRSDMHFGFWTLEESEYGNSIELTIRRVVALSGTELLDHKYTYTIYEEDDGSYSFNFDFGITPGAYYRQIAVEGSANVQYAAPEDFYAAVAMIVETHFFTSAEPNNGFTAELHIYSNNTALLTLYTEYNGANTAVCNAEGTVNYILSADNSTVDGYRVNLTHDATGEVEIELTADYAAFELPISFMGSDFVFDMQPAEIVTE